MLRVARYTQDAAFEEHAFGRAGERVPELAGNRGDAARGFGRDDPRDRQVTVAVRLLADAVIEQRVAPGEPATIRDVRVESRPA